MGDNLAQLLYEAHRSASADYGSLLSWGNIPSDEREQWMHVAEKARAVMSARFVASIDKATENMALPPSDPLIALRERWHRP